MSFKKGQASIKDLSPEEMAKVMELARRLGEETKQKEHYKTICQQLEIENEQLKKRVEAMSCSQGNCADENKFLKLQLRNSLKKLEPLRASLNSTKHIQEKEQVDPNLVANLSGGSETDHERTRSGCKGQNRNQDKSQSKSKEINLLKTEIQKMSKQLKHFSPSLTFIERGTKEQEYKDCQGSKVSDIQEDKVRLYETIRSRYNPTETQSFLEMDEPTKICDPQSRSQVSQYTVRKATQQKPHRLQKQAFYSSDLLDLVEMLE